MRIIFHECKKAFSSPILVALLLLFASFNIFLIFSHSDLKEELQVANELTETYGGKITPESWHRFKQDLQADLVKLNEITRKKSGRDFHSVHEFLDSLHSKDRDLYSRQEWTFFTRLQVKEMYFALANSIDSQYSQLDWRKIAELEVEKYQLSGSAAMALLDGYDQLSQRFEQMKENGEHKQWFLAGKPYRMHSFLFRTMFGHLIFEALILIVLATALISNFEFENGTHLVTYSTKRGRGLMPDKLAASLLTATAITAILLFGTLGAFFSVFDYSSLWGSSISSAFNWEYNLPYVSWWNMSFATFLFCSILLVYACMLLFSAIAFAISLFVKNNYFTFFLCAAGFAIALLLPGFMPSFASLMLITGFNPAVLVMNPHMFFMGNSGLTMFKHYETITVGVWTMIASAFCCISVKTCKKQDIQ
ncbi:hypothetical protein [Brevibacillus borstelensis]|uniref:hypothetical protein n=1 Tax=Brevibacillus borstelensis TaxID=45462 RepID=UPI0030BD2E00